MTRDHDVGCGLARPEDPAIYKLRGLEVAAGHDHLRLDKVRQ